MIKNNHKKERKKYMTRKFIVTIKEIENEDSVAKKTLAREAFMNLIRKKDSLDNYEEDIEESEEEIEDENGNKKKLYIVSKSSPYLTKLFNDIESWVNKD